MARAEAMSDNCEITAITIFAVISVINLIILMVEGILEFAKKGLKMPAGNVIFAGQLAKLIMAVAFAVWLFFALSDKALTAIYIIVGLCAVVCLISAMLVIKTVITERKMKIFIRVLYTIYAFCSIFIFTFALYFQLEKFCA